MDIPISKKILKMRKLQRSVKWLLTLLITVIGFILFQQLITPGINRQEIRTTMVERGEVSTGVLASGVVVPQQTRLLISPISSSIEEIYQPVGNLVMLGDAILKLDSTRVNEDLKRLEDELKLKVLEIQGLQQDQQQQFNEFENQQELLALELESQQVQLERYETLYLSNIVSTFDLETARLNVQKAQIKIRQLEQKIMDTKHSNANQQQQRQLQLQLLQQQFAAQQRLKDQTIVRATGNGIITTLADEIGKNISSGEELAHISDLSTFRINATLSDFYLQQIQVDMPVTIKIGTNATTGQLSQILPAVENGTIQLQIEFTNPAMSELKPNLRAELEILTQYSASSLRVKNGIVFKGSGLQQVFVIESGSAVQRQIEIGMSNSNFVEIINGLALGDEIIISDMSNYEYLEEIAVD